MPYHVGVLHLFLLYAFINGLSELPGGINDQYGRQGGTSYRRPRGGSPSLRWARPSLLHGARGLLYGFCCGVPLMCGPAGKVMCLATVLSASVHWRMKGARSLLLVRCLSFPLFVLSFPLLDFVLSTSLAIYRNYFGVFLLFASLLLSFCFSSFYFVAFWYL